MLLSEHPDPFQTLKNHEENEKNDMMDSEVQAEMVVMRDAANKTQR